MPRSFTAFKDQCFWTADFYLEVWLGALVQEIDRLSSPSEWLIHVREEWHLRATAGFTGFIDADLDTLITTEEEKRLLIVLSEQAMIALATYGDVIPCDVLNALRIDETIAPQEPMTENKSPEPFLLVGKAFIQLLQGELMTTAEGGIPGMQPPATYYR